MANVVIVLDRDPTRRSDFTSKSEVTIAPFPGLVCESREGEDWSVLWAAAPLAPVSVLTDGRTGTFLWGDAVGVDGTRLEAAAARHAMRRESPASWAGFHLAVDLLGNGRLRLIADCLGVLPVYYWTDGDVTLVGTSVESFHAHPSFRAKLDPVGLVGIMLMNGQVGGRTLWSGVRRLAIRMELRVEDGRVSERESFAWPQPDSSLLGLPIEGCVEALHEALGRAMRRIVRSGESMALLLSGGLDSRQLGAYARDSGADLRALTFGLDSDIEMRCAKDVASVLAIPHGSVEVAPGDYPVAAERLARYEGLAAGFSNVLDWGMVPPMVGLPPRVVFGHIFDGVVGGIHIPWAFDATSGRYEFQTIFQRFNRWAFEPRPLRDLLAPSFRDLVEEVLEVLRLDYESTSDRPNLKAWYFDIETRQRFHVGAAVWPMSFASWPVSPIFDRELLQVLASMPASAISGRRLQRELLLHVHPVLGRVPLDRNSHDSLPLDPTIGDRLRGAGRTALRRIVNRLPSNGTSRENRFYYRVYDFGSPGWQRVREVADADRERLPAAVDRHAVDRILPTPQQELSAGDGIVDSSNAKLLLGLAMVCSRFGLD